MDCEIFVELKSPIINCKLSSLPKLGCTLKMFEINQFSQWPTCCLNFGTKAGNCGPSAFHEAPKLLADLSIMELGALVR